MKKQLAIGFVVAGVCMYFAFRGLSFRDTIDVMKTADWRWITTAMILYAAGFGLRSIRWSVLMKPVKQLPPARLFPFMMIGFLANNVLPFRMGEFVRAHITGRKFGVSRTASLGTILLERLFDTISFLSTFAAVAIFFDFPPMVKRGAAGLALMCLGLILVLGALVFRRPWFDAMVHLSPVPGRWKEKGVKLADNFVHGVAGVFQPRFVGLSLVLSLIIWIIEGTVLYLIARAFNAGLGYPHSFFLLFFMGLAVTLPQAPGYVGTLELFGVNAMRILGIAKEIALPVILTVHACQFLFILIVGLACLWNEGMTLGKLARTNEEEAEREGALT